MALDVQVTVRTQDGVDLEWPTKYIEDSPLWGDNVKNYAKDLDLALTEANRVLGSKLKKLYDGVRED